VLLANLSLGGAPDALILKPDGGELYVPVSNAHGLLVVNTMTNEVGDFLILGMSPSAGTLAPDAATLYVSDSAAGHIVPVAIQVRQVQRPITVGQDPRTSMLTPGGDMLLVVDAASNDLAVIRANTPTPRLVTLIPVGQSPRDLAIKVF
jgi:DNA-binding beta-propeller fold protein YncE